MCISQSNGKLDNIVILINNDLLTSVIFSLSLYLNKFSKNLQKCVQVVVYIFNIETFTTRTYT